MIELTLLDLGGSQSWHIRLHVLPVLATVYFRGLPLVDNATASSIMEVLTECLTDKNLEVRDLASSVLSTVLRTSQRASIVVFKVSQGCLIARSSFGVT